MTGQRPVRSRAEVILEHEATIKASWQLREVTAGSPHRRREFFGLEAFGSLTPDDGNFRTRSLHGTESVLEQMMELSGQREDDWQKCLAWYLALSTTSGMALFEVTVRLELTGWQTSTGAYEVEIWGRVICLRLPLRRSDHLQRYLSVCIRLQYASGFSMHQASVCIRLQYAPG
jgi:hypothetical protein